MSYFEMQVGGTNALYFRPDCSGSVESKHSHIMACSLYKRDLLSLLLWLLLYRYCNFYDRCLAVTQKSAAIAWHTYSRVFLLQKIFLVLRTFHRQGGSRLAVFAHHVRSHFDVVRQFACINLQKS